MGCPHATVAGSVLGQAGTHWHAPLTQRSCELQRVPVPGQLAPVQALRMASPQETVSAGGHEGMHSHRPLVQRLPLGQRVPVPQRGPSGQRLRMASPQSKSAGSAAGQAGTHEQVRVAVSQRCPVAQPWSQRPPQPSSSPQAASGAQKGVQVHIRVLSSQRCRAPGQVPAQRPPQPSSAPQAASGGHIGVHWQRPKMHRSRLPRVHGGSQAQVSTQAPLTHT